MTASSMTPLTPSQVKKAGRVLRRHLRGDEVPFGDVMQARSVLLQYRAAHQRPFTTANMGLRSMVRTERCVAVEVSQRLKRVPTILDKLMRMREPTLPLSSMQDIGGCRAVLHSIDEVRRVEARLRRNRPPVAHSDYIRTPRESGYRGVHLVVQYGGRNIEVQLRTRVMHEWAITVERLSGRLGEDLKGDGTHPVQQLLASISAAMALEEVGSTVDVALLDELRRLRVQAAPYLAARGTP